MALENHTIGRGRVQFSPFKPGTYTPAGFRFLGNAPSLTLAIATEKLPHFLSTGGIRVKNKDVTLQVDTTGSMSLDDIQVENLAMLFQSDTGDAATITQTSATAQTETFVDVIQGRSYQLGQTAQNPTGVRSISNVAVTVASASKTVEVDYTVDLVRGIITIVQGGGIANLDDVVVTYNRAAVSRKQVQSGAEQVAGALRFLADNPEGDDFDYYMPYVKLSPNGDFGLITEDDWQAMSLNIEVLTAPGRKSIYLDGQPYTTA